MEQAVPTVHRSMPPLPCALLAASVLGAPDVQPARDCVALEVLTARPAMLELGPWLSAGGSFAEGRTAAWSLGAGLELSTQLTQLGRSRYGGAHELRVGPWVAAETNTRSLRGEGGLSLIVGQESHARFGALGLRLGVGYSTEAQSHLVGVLSYGIRYVPGRADEPRSACDPEPANKPFAWASGARLFAAVRQNTAAAFGPEMSVGVEFEPSWFFPPYTLGKWAGRSP